MMNRTSVESKSLCVDCRRFKFICDYVIFVTVSFWCFGIISTSKRNAQSNGVKIMTNLTAMFDNAKEFAKFNAKPHLFSYSNPFQLCGCDVDAPVYISLASGDDVQFKSRVSQFGGIILAS